MSAQVALISFGSHKTLCRIELARDGGVSASISAGCVGLIASKLAPTGNIGSPLPGIRSRSKPQVDD